LIAPASIGHSGAAMKPSDLLSTLRAKLRSAGIVINQMPLEASFREMLAFYEQERVEGCDVGADADMLLFQWGTYDWGNGGEFEIGLTRQVILPEAVDDSAIWQLHLTYRFIPTEALVSLGAGERWCRTPSEVPELRQLMESTAAYQAMAHQKPQGVTVDYECAG
jgi:hypothetical protein